MESTRARPRRPGRRGHRRTPGASRGRGQAPGRGLPVHLLRQLGDRAPALAPRRRRRAGRGGAGPSGRPGGTTAPTVGVVTVDLDAYLAERGTRVATIRRLLAATARPAGASSAASGCTSGRWSTGWTRTVCGTRTGRCGSEPRAPTGSSRRTGSRCSHFDAFRFFTPTARPLNALQPTARPAGRPRAAGLPARGDGPLQVGVPAGAGRSERAGRGLLRAGPRHPGPRHARLAVRPERPGLPGRSRSRPARARRSTSRPNERSASARRTSGAGFSTRPPPHWPRQPSDATRSASSRRLVTPSFV